MKKNKNIYAIISITILQTYVFFEICDQGVINSLDMALIPKSETEEDDG